MTLLDENVHNFALSKDFQELTMYHSVCISAIIEIWISNFMRICLSNFHHNHVDFASSCQSVPIEKKTFEQDTPRYLEEEGFYVGVRPYVPNQNLNRMENRLLKLIAKEEEASADAKKFKSPSVWRVSMFPLSYIRILS